MAKKTVKKKIGMRMIRNVDLSVWEEYRQFVENRGEKLGPSLSKLMRERMDREKQSPSS